MIRIKINCPQPTGLLVFQINTNNRYELTVMKPGGKNSYITSDNNLDKTIDQLYTYVSDFINLQQWSSITQQMESYINSRNETYFEIEILPQPILTTHR